MASPLQDLGKAKLSSVTCIMLATMFLRCRRGDFVKTLCHVVEPFVHSKSWKLAQAFQESSASHNVAESSFNMTMHKHTQVWQQMKHKLRRTDLPHPLHSPDPAPSDLKPSKMPSMRKCLRLMMKLVKKRLRAHNTFDVRRGQMLLLLVGTRLPNAMEIMRAIHTSM